MTIKAVLFDLYGTLIDIETDEGLEEIYRGLGHFLTYQGIDMRRGEVCDLYRELLTQQKAASREAYPEIDVEGIWNDFLKIRGLRPAARRRRLALTLAQLFRGLSRKRLRLYPGVRKGLEALAASYRLGLISDAQSCYALPEMKILGLDGRFDPIVISARYGFRKPDPRLWREALAVMHLGPTEAVYVGNDMFRDIFGAGCVGLKTVYIDSNQGASAYEQVVPDVFAATFAEVVEGVHRLASKGA